MTYILQNGEEQVTFEVPENWDVIKYAEPQKVPAIPESELSEKIKETLRHPIGCNSLESLVSPSSQIAIAVDDISRHTPAQLLVEPLLDLLYEYGVSKKNIRIIFALGMHREMTEEDAIKKLGPRVVKEIAWENHQLEKNLVDLGKSKAGTPIYVNKNFYDADVKIAIGLIEPHLWAGFSGGAKCVCPGLIGVETIAVHHKKVLDNKTMVGPDIQINPFRKDIEDIVSRTGTQLILNCILNLDTKICQVVAGEPKAAYEKGVELARPVCEVEVPEMADVIISAANPLGLDFRQSAKAAFNTQYALKKNGALIVVSPCYEGAGNLRASDNPPTVKKIRTLFKLGLKSVVWGTIIKSGYGIEDAAGVFQMFKFIAKKNYIMCTNNLDEDGRKLAWMCDHATNIEDAIKIAEKIVNPKKNKKIKCIIFPLGGVTYPILK